MQSTAVLLLQMGGPDSLEAVKPFLLNLFSDREIIKLGPAWLQPLISRLIVSRRTASVVEKYRQIGGGSPLRVLTEAQAKSLSEKTGLPCFVGMRYWKPFTADALKQIRSGGYERIIALSLYPHYSRATTGSSINDLRRLIDHEGHGFQIEIVEHYFDHPQYIQALTTQIKAGIAEFADESTVHILFSAHSLPQSFIDDGDPYLRHIQKTVELVMREFGGVTHGLAFQSRAGPVKWLEPSTDDELRRLATAGHKNLLVVPLSFVSDHIETLHEIDIEYAEEAHRLGITNFKRCRSLNTDPLFISCLADLVWQKIQNS